MIDVAVRREIRCEMIPFGIAVRESVFAIVGEVDDVEQPAVFGQFEFDDADRGVIRKNRVHVPSFRFDVMNLIVQTLQCGSSRRNSFYACHAAPRVALKGQGQYNAREFDPGDQDDKRMRAMPQGKQYVIETRRWLNRRFDLFDSNGVYIPNQPCHAYSALAFRLEEYARTISILLTLNDLDGRSVIDVGCADGYLIGYLSRFMGCDGIGIDLSDQAIEKARHLYGVRGFSANVESLPLRAGSADIVIASETLEHVGDLEAGIRELKRAARKYLIVSMPRSASEQDARQSRDAIDPNEPHAHLHHLTDGEVRDLFGPDALYLGARTRWCSAYYHHAAWADPDSETQRRSYYDFTVESTAIGDAARESLRWFLLDRYRNQPGWKRYASARPLIQRLLLVDALVARSAPRFSHDHLIIWGRGGRPALHEPRIPRSRVVADLLVRHHVPPLRKTT